MRLSTVGFVAVALVASPLGAQSRPVPDTTWWSKPATSGVIDNVLLRWRPQPRGCGQSTAGELYTFRDVEGLMHVAMFEAINAIARRYMPFVATIAAPPGASEAAAASQAAHDVLVAQCPVGSATYAGVLASALSEVRDSTARHAGIAVGKQAAAAVLKARATSGANGVDPYWRAPAAGVFNNPAVERGRLWSKMTPWVLTSPDELRPSAPPALTSETWRRDLAEMQRVGGKRSSVRTRAQGDVAEFWGARDVRIVLRQLIGLPGRTLVQDARLLALAEMAWADTYIAMMDGKYAFNFWRPVTAIRYYAATPMPPSNDPLLAVGDANWEPLYPNPVHPEYPCGHCMSAGAVGAVLEAEFGRELPPIVFDQENALTRRFSSAIDYVNEVSMARLYGGVHYRFSIDVGRAMGLEIGRLAVQRRLRPLAAPTGKGSDGSR
jgi:hypothetical protein